jgi:hypothetical protein
MLSLVSDGPWQAWYHCMCNTYGTWLQGDSRGWRERHHRKHVAGDYRHPPQKGTFETIQKLSKQLMQRDPVRLERELREIALRGVVESLVGDGIVVLVACLDATHLHVLAQFKDLRPRQRLGWAKFFATKQVKQYLNAHGAAVGNFLELKLGEGIWGKRSECVPITDRQHRVNVLNYVAGHSKKGALVWLNPRLPGRAPSI